MDLIDCNIFTHFSRWAVAILMLVYHMTVSLNRDPLETKSRRTKLYIVRCYHFLHPYVAKSAIGRCLQHRILLRSLSVWLLSSCVPSLFHSAILILTTIFLKAFTQISFESNTKA